LESIFKKYFTESHERLRTELRQFVKEKVTPFVDEWEEKGAFPKEILKEMGTRGYLGLRYPKEVGGYGGDYFMNIVLAEEMIRCGAGGFPLAVAVQTDMANPPILEFGTPAQVEKYFKKALQGEKLGAIGITEPNHGSDVANIETKARFKNGKWIINGAKTFITNGPSADYIVLVVRTNANPGYKGISLIIVDLDTPGVTISKKLQKLGMRSSDTALITFEEVEVPEENLLGKEGNGFFQIMWELQGERLIGAAGALALAEYLLEEAEKLLPRYRLRKLHGLKEKLLVAKLFNYGLVRELIDNPSQYDSVKVSISKYYCANFSYHVAQRVLEAFGSEKLEHNNIFERLWRDSRLYRIGGGTDEIMLEIIAKKIGK